MHASFSALKPQPNASNSREVSAVKHDRNAANPIRDTQLYKRILSQSLKSENLGIRSPDESRAPSTSSNTHQSQVPHMVPPKNADTEQLSTSLPDSSSQRSLKIAGMSEEESDNLVRQVAEMAATAAAVAARDATRSIPHKPSRSRLDGTQRTTRHSTRPASVFHEEHDAAAMGEAPGGHDAPNWGRTKSAVILMGATVLYAVIAEILVNTVDVVLESVDIDEKFLGITLFALVPNTTEFLVCEVSFIVYVFPLAIY